MHKLRFFFFSLCSSYGPGSRSIITAIVINCAWLPRHDGTCQRSKLETAIVALSGAMEKWCTCTKSKYEKFAMRRRPATYNSNKTCIRTHTQTTNPVCLHYTFHSHFRGLYHRWLNNRWSVGSDGCSVHFYSYPLLLCLAFGCILFALLCIYIYLLFLLNTADGQQFNRFQAIRNCLFPASSAAAPGSFHRCGDTRWEII